MMSLESSALEKCQDQLEALLKFDFKDFSSFLFRNKIICDEVYGKIINSPLTDSDKSAQLVQHIKEKVKLNSSYFFKLVNSLRQNKTFGSIVDALDSEYFSLRGRQTAMITEDLHKELLTVKDKWRIIGECLMTSKEQMDKFVELSDPLLEMIVHWVKSARDMPPSWDAIVLVLRNPQVNEPELADKISQLYCDHEEYSKVHQDCEAASDVTSELVRVPLQSNYQLANANAKFAKHKLQIDTKEIKQHFSDFLSTLQEHLSDLQKLGTLDTSVILSQLVMYEEKLKAPLNNCKTFQQIFDSLVSLGYCSFINYDLIKILADHAGDTMRGSFVDYKMKLQQFFQKHMFELESEEGKKYAIIIDESISEEIKDLTLLENRVKLILGQKNLTLLPFDSIHSSNFESMKGHEVEQCTAPSQDNNLLKRAIQDECRLNVPDSSSRTSPKKQNKVHDSLDHSSKSETTPKSVPSPQPSTNDSKKQQLAAIMSGKTTTFQEEDFLENELDNEFLQLLDTAKQLSSKSQLHEKASEGDLSGVLGMMEGGYNPLDKDENGNTALHLAAAKGHLHIVKHFVENLGFSAAMTGCRNYTLLHSSITGGHLAIVKYLLHEVGVEVLCEADKEMSPLHVACYYGHDAIVVELLKNIAVYMPVEGGEFSCSNVGALSPLHFAALGGHLSLVKYLTMERKFDPMCKDKDGNMPLHAAAMQGHTEVVKFLSSHFSYDPMVVNSKGNTAMHFAALHGHFDIVKYFVEEKQSDPVLSGSSNFTLLHFAAKNGSLPLVKYLIDLQDYDSYCAKRKRRSTPLHLAAHHGHLSIVEFLIAEKKCDPMSKDMFGHTPLHCAVWRGHIDVTKLVSSFSINHNDTTIQGRSALHMAAFTGNLAIAKHLIEEKGCNSFVLDKFKKTPLSHSILGGHLSIIKYLISHEKCDLNQKDLQGRNAFLQAAASGQLEVVELLCSKMNCTPEMVDQKGRNALFVAALEGHIAIVMFLAVEKGYDLLCKDLTGSTPLHAAAIAAQINVLKFYASKLNELHQVIDKKGRNALHFAALGGSLHVLKYLIVDEHFNPSTLDDNGQTPLHMASTSGHLPVVKYLMQEVKCDPLVKDKLGETPFMSAARANQSLIVHFFTTSLKDTDTETIINRKGCNLLHLAANGGNTTLVRHLVEDLGYKPTTSDAQLRCPVEHAVFSGHLETVKYLVTDKGCDPLYENKGLCLIHLAASKGYLDIVKYLIFDGKCEAMIRSPGYGEKTAIHYAAASGHLDIVKFYIENLQCDPLSKDQSGSTPLHLAASSGHMKIIKYLAVYKTLSLKAVDADGRSCLHASALKGHLQAVQFFVDECSLSPEVKDFADVTPLHLACWKGHLSCISYLVLQKKCSPHCRDKAFDTPLHWAAKEGNLEVIKFFGETIHCSLIVENEGSKTPLDYAIFYGHHELVQYFQAFACSYLKN